MKLYQQVVSPDLGKKVLPGWCLKFVQDSFRAPVMHATATEAANATKLRNSSRNMPNVSVPVWFWHSGTYGGVTGEFGHVVVWVPGRGFLSSPSYSKWVGGVEQPWSQWFSSIEEIEKVFTAKYRFWSLDINTLQVAKEVHPPTPGKGQKEDDMPRYIGCYIGGDKTNPANKNSCVIYEPTSGFYTTWAGVDQAYTNEMARTYGTASFNRITQKHWERSILPQLLIQQGKK